jgi:uncharacterized membrane protein (UPF0127 family)
VYGRGVPALRFAIVSGVLAAVAACSNGHKRDDAPARPAPPPVTSSDTVTDMPKVVFETPDGEVTVRVEVVDTPAKIERGLMFREHLPPDDGMLFLMGHEYDHAFYMRNTLIPLDMIFIKKDMTVAGVVENATPRTETLRRVGVPSLYVLEVNGGWAAPRKVGPGTKVRFVGVRP